MDILILISLCIVAFLYSSVGHGGASGYLAVMVIFGISAISIKSSALMMNLVVSGISFISFYRSGYFKPKLILPFISTSIPFAFIGARVHVDTTVYHYLLGGFLLFAAIRLIIDRKIEGAELKKLNIPLAIFIGAVLGFISGLIGIGGGIFLSPIILFMKWAKIKETAACSALFIWVNSASGIFGLINHKLTIPDGFIWWIIAVIAGGTAGSMIGSRYFNFKTIKYLLAVILFFAGIKIFIQ